MTPEALTGSRIRERRVMAGLKQAELARLAGISPSYLNLIEHNRRRIGGKLLLSIAEALGVQPSLLSEGAEAALVAGLREAAARHTGNSAELDRAEEFAGRFPGWAELLVDARRRIDALERTVESLSDRLTHDPHLAASMHEVLSTVTAIRSTAAILAETGELEPEWQDRFHRNLNEDSRRLAGAVQGLVNFLDAAGEDGANLTSPQEELEVFFGGRAYHFAELEGPSADIDALLGAEAAPVSTTARATARRLLERYRADAVSMPLSKVARVIAREGPDPAALSRATGADLAAAMRRLAQLPGDLVPSPLGLVICDGAGTLTFRKPLDDFPLPRFGAGCPYWPLFEALSRPSQPVARLMAPAGAGPRLFHGLAVAQPVAPADFDRPGLFEATMLVVPAAPPVPEDTPALPVGVSCRICPRTACPGRREPSILAEGF